MKILSLDTSSKVFCLSFYDGEKFYGYRLEAGTKLSLLLHAAIRESLEALGWKVQDIDYLACGLGPGSFTGIRQGVAAIKGLAWAINKPVVAIPTLEVLARSVAQDNTVIMPCLDAKRDLVYCAAFQKKRKSLKELMPASLVTPQQFIRRASRYHPIITGDALAVFGAEFRRGIPKAKFLDKDYWYPRSYELMGLALEKIKQKKFSRKASLEPIYLYPEECQIRKYGNR